MSYLSEKITPFITSKRLSENSQKSYHYDLRQFCQLVEEQISDSKLRLYENFLSDLKLSARKRKISTVNQFLLYLYDQGKISAYYHLKNREKLRPKSRSQQRLDLSNLYQATDSTGKWIALLILELGLSPSEIAAIKVEEVDQNFDVLTIKKSGQVRILPFSDILKPLFENLESQTYLFDNRGNPYSRQWFFNQLNAFLQAEDFSDLTAQKLREQFIINQVAQGTDLLDLAKKLGLKTPLTLEPYYKNGY
ncbi:site-specific tyrosine recombinase XerD [Streptococcus dentapri]|uniref:Tyrosine recombinase XerD-like n=1 Tax=Streptococcus dentapri TaxID=573564 RepID=A0ABV8D408_9STRE